MSGMDSEPEKIIGTSAKIIIDLCQKKELVFIKKILKKIKNKEIKTSSELFNELKKNPNSLSFISKNKIAIKKSIKKDNQKNLKDLVSLEEFKRLAFEKSKKNKLDDAVLANIEEFIKTQIPKKN